MKALRLVGKFVVAVPLVAAVLGAATQKAAHAVGPIAHTVTCGRTLYALRAQTERNRYPGLSAPWIYYDSADADTTLDGTYLRSSARNDVRQSAFEIPAGHQFHPVAQHIGLTCDENNEPVVIARLLRWGDIEPGTRLRDFEFADYAADDVITPDPAYTGAPGDGEWLRTDEYVRIARGRNPKHPKKDTLTVQEAFSFVVRVDPSLDIRLPEVEGFNEGDPIRPTGRASWGGHLVDYVLDEIQVLVADDSELQAILERWSAQLVDRSPLDRQGNSTALIRLDPAVLANLDTSHLAEDLLLIEPHQGQVALSSERLAQLFAVMAIEVSEHGTLLSPNVLLVSNSITSGSTSEGPLKVGNDEQTLDAFKFDFMTATTGMKTGVGWAWQVIDATVGFDRNVSLMVIDGGFQSNGDFPDNVTLRQTEWGTPNPLTCSGVSCPWHGSDVALTAIAAVDNGEYTAGPAGPVIDHLILVGIYKDEYKTLRRARDMVAEYRPDVVTMSISGEHWAFRKFAEAVKDWYFAEITIDYGALFFACAGNDGDNVDATISGDETPTVLPCESALVVCVGGIDANHKTVGNYGTKKGVQSVEIYGPVCTYGREDNDDFFNPYAKKVCGTSVATPFVAGVAALVKSIAPSLTQFQLRDLLYATAITGAPFTVPLSGGWDRRINAYRAVTSVMNLVVHDPSLTIVNPAANSQVGKDDGVDVRAIAHDTFNRPLSIRWSSDKDGYQVTTSTGVFAPINLSTGLHTLTASTKDFRGVVVEKTVKVQVGYPPTVTIVSPQPSNKIYEQQVVHFTAQSFDPDTYGPIADDDIVWNIRKNGVDWWAAIGHDVKAPHNKFTPGVYDIYVTATDDEGEGSDHGTFTVLALPPGQDPPHVTILLPANNLYVESPSGYPQSIHFNGEATDPQDGTVSGTRFRWSIHSNFGTTKILCVGSNFPGQGDGGIGIPLDCSSFQADIGPDGPNPLTKWVLKLEVYDSSNLPGSDEHTITVQTTEL